MVSPRIASLIKAPSLNTASLLVKAFTQADDAVNLTDTAGILVRVNQAYPDLYRFASDDEILGKSQRIIRSAHTPNDVYKAMWKCISAATSVIKGVERIKKVLEHLLAYSRKEGPQRHSTLSVLQLVEESFLFIERQFSNRGIVIDIEADEDLLISGNRTQLESTIHNLLHNSRDAFEGRDGAKRIEIRIRNGSDGFGVIEYRDNAGGISDSNLPHIFEPFFTTKGEAEGTGLGLTISKKIVAEHGGTIDCESQDGKTLFRIQLPLISGANMAFGAQLGDLPYRQIRAKMPNGRDEGKSL